MANKYKAIKSWEKKISPLHQVFMSLQGSLYLFILNGKAVCWSIYPSEMNAKVLISQISAWAYLHRGTYFYQPYARNS